MSALTPMEESVAQALRRSHCANPGGEHKCVGQMKISADGVCLDCKLCGSDSARIPSAANDVILRRIMKAAGLDWDSLDLERQLRVEKEYVESLKPIVRFA